MHRLTTSWLGRGAWAAVSLAAVSLAAVSCGSPVELDPNLYPAPDDTGYVSGDSTGSAGTPLGGAAAGGQAPGGQAPGGQGADGQAAGGQPVGAPSGGNATPPAANGDSGGVTPAAGGGASAGGCPDDITVLFDRPLADGGCAGAGCHVANGTPPDLVSPGLEARLIDVISTCNGRPFIGADDSFLADKISGERPECGSPMPFLSADLLSADDRQCILDWIDEVSGG